MKNPLPSGLERLVVILVVLVLGLQTSADDLKVAGSHEHAWFLIPSPETETEGYPWSLSHSGSQENPPVHRSIRRFKDQPTSLAALKDSVWFTLPSSEGQAHLIPVRVLQMEWNSSLERYLPTPRSGMTLLPSIQTDVDDPGIPESMVATTIGPVVFLKHQSGQRSLQALRRGHWQVIELPSDVCENEVVLACPDDRITLFREQDDGLLIQVWTGEDWSAARFQEGLSRPIHSAPIGDRLLMASEASPDMMKLDFLQTDGLARLSELPIPEGGCSLLARGDKAMLVRHVDHLEISQLDLLDGTQSPWVKLPEGSVLGVSTWSLLVSILLSGLVLVIILRGGQTNEASWPQGSSPLAPFGRLIALAVDAVPGLIVTIGWLGAKPRIILDAFSFSLSAEDWLSYGTLVVITCLWCLIWEMAVRSSPGKMLMRGYLGNLDGSRPSVGRLCLRSCFKCIMLLFPILMVTALRPPSLQSLGDQFSGILVLERIPSKSDQDSQDGDKEG